MMPPGTSQVVNDYSGFPAVLAVGPNQDPLEGPGEELLPEVAVMYNCAASQRPLLWLRSGHRFLGKIHGLTLFRAGRPGHWVRLP